MSGDDSGEKTEKPTSKKLRDARKEGNVAKSKDLSQTVTTLIWALIFAGLGGLYADRMGGLLEQAWVEISDLSPQAMLELSVSAGKVLLLLTVLPLALVSVIGILAEFMQAGPVLSFKKITPQGSHVNPAEGLKRVFSMDNLFETFKAIAKTAVLIAIVTLLLLTHLDEALELPRSDVLSYAKLDHYLLLSLMAWVVALFLFFSIADWLYQKYSHEKKLRMSMHDIKEEHKEQEGDPQIKGKRKQLHKQLATQNVQQMARKASAVVVNPTHIAVALYYQPEETVVPMITVKGEGDMARLIREAAEEAGVPIMRNFMLARQLNFRGDEDDFVPQDLFDAVAEVLVWAEQVKREAQANGGEDGAHDSG
ncbi:MAG: type III secretion system export apparatus subunit SctU [Pseudomonadales bacterium]